MDDKQITRRQFLVGTGAAALSLPFINLGETCAEERPNFVFILTDDQRYDAMSCAGHPFLHTPNMDRIAKEGAHLKNTFVTTSLCSPSRACFLTGKNARSHGIKNNKTPLGDDTMTFPRALQQAGYETAFIGKWHMGPQDGVRPGFNRWVSFKGQGVYWNPDLNIDGEKVQATGYMTDILTKHAVDWLKKSRNAPFCLYLSHKATHGPFTPPVRYSKLFSDVKVPKPESMDENFTGKPKWLQTRKRMTYDDGYQNWVRQYNRTVMGIDDSVGRVLSTLEGLGILDNTVVVFAGDNGYFQGEHGLGDKRAMYEESIRIPMVMRYPKLVKPGTVVDKMVLNIDLCPTFLDLAGVKLFDGIQGKSIRPLLKGKTTGWRSDFFYEYIDEEPFKIPTTRGVRTERWKYIEYPEADDICELYDLKNDPAEMHNLINDPSKAEVVKDMRKRLERMLTETPAALGILPLAAGMTASKPNILYIHSHDTGRYVQPYGHPIPTPGIQKLAEEGVLFSQAFCMAPTCSPSRAAMLTGQCPHNSGMLGLAHRGFSLKDVNQHIVQTLKKAGYYSALVGAQHVAGRSKDIGYDRIEPGDLSAHVAAVELLKSGMKEPFFLSVGFGRTHRMGRGFNPKSESDSSTGDKGEYGTPPLPLPDQPSVRADMADFAASAKELDAGIGKVLDALKENGLAENTLVICTTDHGIAFPLMKCNLTDNGIGVMLIMRGPGGFTGGRACDALVSQVDVYPTICELAGVKPPAWLQGKSIMPLIRNETKEINEEVFAEVSYHAAYEPQRAVRTKKWKYIRRYDPRPGPVLPNCDDSPTKDIMMEMDWGRNAPDMEQLYDLENDPAEMKNLINDPSKAEVVKDMRGRLDRWMKDTNDPLLLGPVPAPSGATLNDPNGISPRDAPYTVP